MTELIVHFLVGLLQSVFWFWMGKRAGRREMLKAAVDHVLKQAVPRRNYEERMLDYARLQDSRPTPRVIL